MTARKFLLEEGEMKEKKSERVRERKSEMISLNTFLRNSFWIQHYMIENSFNALLNLNFLFFFVSIHKVNDANK